MNLIKIKNELVRVAVLGATLTDFFMEAIKLKGKKKTLGCFVYHYRPLRLWISLMAL